MQDVISDRRLYLTVDQKRVVEEGGAGARFLLAGAGCTIKGEEVERLKLGTKNGRITYKGAPRLGRPRRGASKAEEVDPDPRGPERIELGDPTGGRPPIDEEGEPGTGSAERAPPKGSDESAVAGDDLAERRKLADKVKADKVRAARKREAEARKRALEAEAEAAAAAAEAEAEAEGAEEEAGDSDRNEGDAPEWTLQSKPETYLLRNPTGPNAELARAVIAAAAEDGADGES